MELAKFQRQDVVLMRGFATAVIFISHRFPFSQSQFPANCLADVLQLLFQN